MSNVRYSKLLPKYSERQWKFFITLPDIELSNKTFMNNLYLIEDEYYLGRYKKQLMEINESIKECENDLDIQENQRKYKVKKFI